MPDRLSRIKVELLYLGSFHSSRFLNMAKHLPETWNSYGRVGHLDGFFRVVHSHSFDFDVNRFDGTKRIGWDRGIHTLAESQSVIVLDKYLSRQGTEMTDNRKGRGQKREEMERMYIRYIRYKKLLSLFICLILSDNSRLIRFEVVSLIFISLWHLSFFKWFIEWRKITSLGESGNRLIFVCKRSLIGLSHLDIAELWYNGIANKLKSHVDGNQCSNFVRYCSCQTTSRIFVRMITLKFPTRLWVMNNLIGIREFNYIWIIGRGRVHCVQNLDYIS